MTTLELMAEVHEAEMLQELLDSNYRNWVYRIFSDKSVCIFNPVHLAGAKRLLKKNGFGHWRVYCPTLSNPVRN